uniref:Reverse transcriptase domain-containing protein n=1 Tax=Elaeophora elaphi TaxID=1147741 RepID=A0A0R3S0Q3_9BILA
MKQRPDIALTEMQLCNDADVPLLFKLCSDTTSSITAAPAGSGCIPPRAEQRCFLTWRRSKHQQIQQDMKAPKLILITNFVEQEIDNNQTMITKLIARMHSEGEKAQGEIPLMKFTFERKEVISPTEILSLRKDDTAT